MDVILDSNIYLSDIRFAKAGFEGLFAYLRRTGHHLVIPEVVFEEVLARHRARLAEAINQATSSWNNARRLQPSGGVSLPNIDIDAESKSLLKRLLQPTNWVKSVRYGKNSKITPMDVALRGIHRVKPASAEGEQLRDVLLWMQVLEYAQEARHGVAFISQNKKDFCEKDHNKLHSDLVEECARLRVDVHFYFDIAEFLRAHSLAQSPFTESQLPPDLTFKELDSKIAFNVANERTTYGYPDEFQVLEIAFRGGTLFKISEATSIAELNYEGQVKCRFKQSFLRKAWLEPLPQISQAEMAEFLRKRITLRAEHTLPIIFTNPAEFDEPVISERLLKFQAMVSARFRDGKLVSWDVESFKLLETPTAP